MTSALRTVGTAVLAAAIASPLCAQPAGATPTPRVASASDESLSLASHLESARQALAGNRPEDAQRELAAAVDLVRAARASAPTARPAGALPRAGRDLPMPALLKRVEPDYPLEAARAGTSGHVVVDLVIDKNGAARNVKVVHSVPGLDRAALDAVKRWRFAKPRVDGAPAAVSATLVLTFTHRRTSQPAEDIDLGQFFAERRDYDAAEPRLARARETIASESACFASAPTLDRPRRGAAPGPDGLQSPAVIREVKPQYTALAMKAKVQGRVTTEAVVDENGRVACARVVKSIPLLDQAAIDAVSRWEFVPARRSGAPTPVRIQIELSFAIR